VTIELSLLVLFAATLHASWNALVKAGRDPLVTQMIVFAVAGLWALVLLPFLPPPDPESRTFLLLSVLIHLAYYIVLAQGYTTGDLSLVYPIARGMAPLLVAVLAAVYADEPPRTAQATGIALVSLGILSLAWGQWRGRDQGRAVLYAVLTGLTISAYTTVDGLGVRATAIPLSYIAWLFVLQGSVFAIVTVVWRGPAAIRGSMAGEWRRGVAGGTIAALSYAIVIWAMSLGPIASISALRESSVVIAALLGVVFLGESLGRRRVIAALVVAAGAAVLSVAG